MRRPLLITVAVLLLGVIAALCWPSPGYSRSKVDSRLTALREPFRSVVIDYYLDGGSVGIRIADHDGQVREYALPVSDTNPRRYDKVFIGAMHLRDQGKAPTEMKNCADTKNMLIQIVSRYSPRDSNKLAALCALRGLPRDYAAVWLPSLFQ